MNKVVIDLDDPIWLEDGGFGMLSIRNSPYCALGKLSQHTQASCYKEYYNAEKLLNDSQSRLIMDIYRTNDRRIDGKHSQDSHQAALRLMFEKLMESGNVEFKGTKVADILGVKVNV